MKWNLWQFVMAFHITHCSNDSGIAKNLFLLPSVLHLHAAQDFKEAARLSAEAKALAASLDHLQADSRKLGHQLVEVDAKEAALAEQIKEMRAMQKVRQIGLITSTSN
jgi:hypothetical protein